jgi:hypothetical protein
MYGMTNMGIKLYNKFPIKIREVEEMRHFKRELQVIFIMAHILLCREIYVCKEELYRLLVR